MPLNLSLVQDRTIRVFVSSTFLDMKTERDVLATHVFPRLRHLCAASGLTFIDVDLRWGIDVESAARGRVVELCLREIDRSAAVVVLIGTRYGSGVGAIPSDVRASYPWLEQATGLSATAIEVRHALSRRARDKCECYAYVTERRGAEPTEQTARDRDALNDLRARVTASGCPRRDYIHPSDLADLVMADLAALITAVASTSSDTERDLEGVGQAAFRQHRAAFFLDRPDELRPIRRALARPGPTIVRGDAGTGKTATLIHWLTDAARTPYARTWSYFAGATPASTTWTHLLTRLTSDLTAAATAGSAALVEHDADAVTLQRAAAEAVTHCARQGSLLLVIDGLDRLEIDGADSEVEWLPREWPDGVKLVVSTRDPRQTAALAGRQWETCELPGFSRADRHAFIEGYLARFGKFFEREFTTLVARHPLSANVLFMRTLLDELRVVGQFGHLDADVRRLANAHDQATLFSAILVRCVRDYGGPAGVEVGEVLALMACTRWGLTEVELRQLGATESAPLPAARLTPLFNGLGDQIYSRDGALCFAHDALTTAIRAKFAGTTIEMDARRRKLAGYFEPIAAAPRALQELPWQLEALRDWHGLSAWLRRDDVLEAAWRVMPMDVQHWWTQVHVHDAPVPHSTYPVRRPLATHIRSVLHRRTGQATLARQEAEALLAYAASDGSPAVREMAAADAALALRELGDTAAARRQLLVWERLAREAGNDRALARCLMNHGVVAREMGDLPGSERCFQEASQISGRTEDWTTHASALASLGQACAMQGRLDDARAWLEQAERRFRLLGDLRGVANCLSDRASIARGQHQYSEARAFHRRQEAICRRLGDAEGLETCLVNVALLDIHQGDYDAAVRRLEEAESSAKASGRTPAQARAMYLLAGCFYNLGQTSAARRLAADASALARPLDLKSLTADIQALIALIDRAT